MLEWRRDWLLQRREHQTRQAGVRVDTQGPEPDSGIYYLGAHCFG